MYRDMFQLKRNSMFHKATFLGVGPMSVNCVDATIEIANEHRIPLMLIASRRQVDSEQLGGGYVNNWTTESFCRYVQNKDKRHQVILARDHGGPWQSDVEVNEQMNLQEAMSSAKDSYRTDIASGMSIIHIDPGRSVTGANIEIPEFIKRTQELMLFCYQEADRLGKKIAIEVGTDEGIVGSSSVEKIESMLLSILGFCKIEQLPAPSFMVMQTGTKVMEMRNVGILDELIRERPDDKHYCSILKLIQLCSQNNILLKEHNADYLSDKTLSWHTQIGIDSANIAPEFGVIETKAFLNFLKINQLNNLYDRTIELAFNSGKWKKWMLKETYATDHERAVIAGHYIFATQNFHDIKNEAQFALKHLGINLDDMLKDAVKMGLYRCIRNFGLIPQNSNHKFMSQNLAPQQLIQDSLLPA